MDKMLTSKEELIITGDGGQVLKKLTVKHPAAKLMVEAALDVDKEVGDGAVSTVVLAGALLERADQLIDRGLHPSTVAEGYLKALEEALKVLDAAAIRVKPLDRRTLTYVAASNMVGTLMGEEAHHLAGLVAEAAARAAEKRGSRYVLELDHIAVRIKRGHSIQDSWLVDGYVLNKEILHPHMPRRVERAKIALTSTALDFEKTKIDAEVRITDPHKLEEALRVEADIQLEQARKVVELGANVVLTEKGMDKPAMDYLSRHGVMGIRKVKKEDMIRLAKALGANIRDLDDMRPEDLGYAELVEQRRIEKDRWVFFEGCRSPKAVSIVVRGGTEKALFEAERCVKDSLKSVKDVIENPYVLTGGGAAEAWVAHHLRQWARQVGRREQLAILAYAEALEHLPLTIAANAGLDPLDIRAELRARMSEGKRHYGVDALNGGVRDMRRARVYDPLVVKRQVIKSASELAAAILRVDFGYIAKPKPPEPRLKPWGGRPIPP
jgi:chaperonin GroEL (HSP60 family)